MSWTDTFLGRSTPDWKSSFLAGEDEWETRGVLQVNKRTGETRPNPMAGGLPAYDDPKPEPPPTRREGYRAPWEGDPEEQARNRAVVADVGWGPFVGAAEAIGVAPEGMRAALRETRQEVEEDYLQRHPEGGLGRAVGMAAGEVAAGLAGPSALLGPVAGRVGGLGARALGAGRVGTGLAAAGAGAAENAAEAMLDVVDLPWQERFKAGLVGAGLGLAGAPGDIAAARAAGAPAPRASVDPDLPPLRPRGLKPLSELPRDDFVPMTDAELRATDARQLREGADLLLGRRAPEPADAGGKAVTEAGTEVPFRYRLMEADELVASHDERMNPNPAYPAELQPRDRTRAASEVQVARMAQKLDPELLGENRLVAHGAPLIGPDGVVESGNARTLAVRRAYGLDRGGPYRRFLAENADRFGIDPAQVGAMRKPVLVRERLGEVADRAQLAREANVASVAALSVPEQAAVDAARLPADVLDRWIPNERGDVATAANRPFVQGFLETATDPSELGRLVDAGGQLSQEGARRVNAALLASGYQDTGLVARIVESGDEQLRGLGKALLAAAPRFAALRNAARAGTRLDLDLAPNVAQAAEKLAELRATPRADVPGFLKQQQLFGAFEPETLELLRIFDEQKRSPKRVAQVLHRYTELVDEAGDPRQVALAPPDPVSRLDLLRQAEQEWVRAGERSLFEEAVEVPVASAGEGGYLKVPLDTPKGPSFFRRFFTSDGDWAALGKLAGDVHRRVETGRAEAKAGEARVGFVLRDFNRSFANYVDDLRGKGVKQSIDDVFAYVVEGLEGGNDLSGVSPQLRAAALAARAHMDELTGGYLDTNMLTKELRLTLEQNLGKYMRRSFEGFRNPDWERIVTTDPKEKWRWDGFLEWAQKRNPDWTPEEVEGYAYGLLRKDPQAFLAVTRSGPVRSLNLGNLKRRIRAEPELNDLPSDLADAVEKGQKTLAKAIDEAKARPGWQVEYMAQAKGLPQEIDDLLGLDQDPSIRYRESALRAVHDLATYKTMRDVRDMGFNRIFFDNHVGQFSERIGGKGPLAEMYSTPEIAAVFRGMGNTSRSAPALVQAYLYANGMLKLGKTAGNFPAGHMRNALAWPFIHMANGHFVAAFNTKRWSDATRTVVEGARGTKPGKLTRLLKTYADGVELASGETLGSKLDVRQEALRARYLRWTELGVLGDAASQADVAHYLGLRPRGAPERVSAAAKSGFEFMASTWVGGDEVGKLLDAEVELANYAHATETKPGTPEWRALEERVATIVRDTTPTGSLAAPIVRGIRDFPLVGAFPTFWSEIFRNSKNILRLGARELLDENPKIRLLGARRLAGIGTMIAAPVALAWGAATAAGEDPDDREHLRPFVPPWNRLSQLALTDVDKAKGEARILDLSALIPYSVLTDPLVSVLEGVARGEVRDGTVDAVEEALSPFLEEEILTKAFLDFTRNQKQKGGFLTPLFDLARERKQAKALGPVYQQRGQPDEVAKDIGEHFYRAMAPGFLGMGERVLRAAELPGVKEELPNMNKYGRVFRLSDELLAAGGLRFQTTDVGFSVERYGAELATAVRQASGNYNQAKRLYQGKNPSKLLEEKANANAAARREFEQVVAVVGSARALGFPDQRIRGWLLESRLGIKRTNELMQGRFVPPVQ